MSLDRRAFLSLSSCYGLASTLFPGALYTLAAQDAGHTGITLAMLDQAAALAGISLAPEHKAAMLERLGSQREAYSEIRKLHLPNSVPPAYVFDPLPPGAVLNREKQQPRFSKAPAITTVPANLEELAFAPAMHLADLLHRRKVSSTNLTEMYLTRLKRYDPVLHFVITLTEERALTHARAADAEIAAGNYRGPLHGLPWGAKDLLAVKGYPTTWGAGGFEHQAFDEDAVVVQRLDAAGAVLVAKTSLGALANGRQVVCRPHPQSLEPQPGLQRLLCRLGFSGLGRLRGVCYRF